MIGTSIATPTKKMAKSKWIIIKGLIRNEVGELKNELVGSNIMNTPKNQSPADEAKNKADNERREQALRAFQKERQKRREKEEFAREKFRDAIRQKYGIERNDKTPETADSKKSQDAKRSHNLNESESKDCKEDLDNRRDSFKKFTKKLDEKQRKKDLKEQCVTQ